MAPSWLCRVLVLGLASQFFVIGADVVTNGGFESLDGWSCYHFHCTLSPDSHSGQHSMQASDRPHVYSGPSQEISVHGGHTYGASAWIKLLSDPADHSSSHVMLMLELRHTDQTRSYMTIASHPPITSADGWTHLAGEFLVPTDKPLERTRIYYQGPDTSVNFLVDDVIITEQLMPALDGDWRKDTDDVIDRIRKSDIHVRVVAGAGVDQDQLEIQVEQEKKSFPFGTAMNANFYNEPSQGKYRDFAHQHFNWAVPENSLKWQHIEPHQGDNHIQDAIDMINGLRSHGLKVRGHNLVWSVDRHVQSWVKARSGSALRDTVTQHIQQVMNRTRGLLEHWDVNNENLHGTWYQDRLHDPDYDLELFREAHAVDSHVKLFLNDYAVVASGAFTEAYEEQARRFKAADVGLYGLGVQCHFHVVPNPLVIKERLDKLAQVGVPLWATELDVRSTDEEKRADYYETALRALYGHPAVEGILMWGYWDQRHWLGEQAALVKGDNLQLTAAGRRVLDLLENQWMTDETQSMAGGLHKFTVRGFHGDYKLRVRYQGRELSNLTQTFTLGADPENIVVHVHP